MKRVLFSFCLILFGVLAFAQPDFNAPVERDPSILYGKLDNGLTYYIKHNEKPANRAEYYLLTNVGAIQESYEQSGLAHFLEHMAFNGTKNLPGKDMLNYLQSIGANFGGNINAGTGVEQTSYMLNNIPTDRQGIIDTCLLIMHDYSGYITIDPEEVDKERGVIIEEWRTRRTAQFRTFEESIKYLYKGSKFETCNLIGRVENLETFPVKELKDFYQTWYRPDLQAVVVVGDVDPEAILAQMKDLFKDVPSRENPEPKGVYVTPDNDDPIVGILTDPETRNTAVEVYIKTEPVPVEMRSYKVGFLADLLNSVFSSMISERLQEAAMKPNAPFLAAAGGCTSLNNFNDAIVMTCATNAGKEDALKGLAAGLVELEKARRYGFTADEFERAKASMIANVESEVKALDTKDNAQYIGAIQNDFFMGWPATTPQYREQLLKDCFSVINVDVINAMLPQLFSFDKNVVALYSAPAKEGVVHPAEAEIAAIIKSISSMEIENTEQEAIPTELMNGDELKGSKVVKEEKGAFGSTVWTLENGIKVVLRPSDYDKEQVAFTLDVPGGLSMVEDSDIDSFDDNFVQLYDSYAGLGDYPATMLMKILAGKIVGTALTFSDTHSIITGNAAPKDFETLIQMLYMSIVNPRFNEDEFAPAMNQMKAIVPNLEGTPDFAFGDHWYKTRYGNNPRMKQISSEKLEKMSLEVFARNYKRLFGNLNGANFYLLGNYDPETVKPLIEKYIGSLPSTSVECAWVDRNVDLVKGNVEDVFAVTMETPKTTVGEIYSANLEANSKNRILMSFVEGILSMLYTDTIREDEGGTYGVGVQGTISSIPKSVAELIFQFDTDPTRADKLIKLAESGLESIATEGPKAEYFNNTKNNMLKDIPENRIKNSYWNSRLLLLDRTGVDMDTDIEDIINSITPADVQAFMKQLLSQGNKIKIQMNPVE